MNSATRPCGGSWPLANATIRIDAPEQRVAALEMLERVADKWTLPVLGALEAGPRRYCELQRAVPGIAQRALERTLRHAERDGFIERTAYRTFPPRVDYEITALGRGVLVPLRELQEWLVEHRAAVEAAHQRFDGRSR